MDALTVEMMLLPLVWPPLIAALFLQIVPDITRPGLFFGVTVDPQFRESDLARTIRRRYSIAIWIATFIVIAMATCVALANPTGVVSHPSLHRATWLLQLAAGIGAFIRANRATRPHAIQRAAVVHVELSTKPDRFWGPLVAVGVPPASLAALGLWSCLRWDDIPSELPVHWSFARADHWVSTTPASIATLLGLHFLVCAIFALLAWGVMRGSRRISTSGESALREQRFRNRIVLLLVTLEYFNAFPAWAALLGLPPTAMQLWGLALPFLLLVLVGGLVLAGQGGLRNLARSGSTPLGDRTDDRHWRWGLLYFNRADPAFLIEKRFGIGYTFNFAHPFAWALLALIAAIPLIGEWLQH